MHALPRRVVTCPPQSATGATLETLWRWLDGGWAHAPGPASQASPGQPAATPGRGGLSRARAAFLESVDDLPGMAGADLQRRIRVAAALNDLWHLRAEIFARVSRIHDQAEAQQRLACLNRHFATRRASSGFIALDTTERAS